MTEKELWKMYIEAFNTHSAEAVSELFDEKCTFSDSAKETLGFDASRLCGKEEVKAFFTELFAKYNGLNAKITVQFGAKTFYDVSGAGRNPLRMNGYMDMYHDKIKTLDIWFRDV